MVIPADILLAERCFKAGAAALAHNGKPFDAAVQQGGPANFLQALDRVLVRMGRC